MDIDCSSCATDDVADVTDECINIVVPDDDRIMPAGDCMSVTRSAAWPAEDCENGEFKKNILVSVFTVCVRHIVFTAL